MPTISLPSVPIATWESGMHIVTSAVTAWTMWKNNNNNNNNHQALQSCRTNQVVNTSQISDRFRKLPLNHQGNHRWSPTQTGEHYLEPIYDMGHSSHLTHIGNAYLYVCGSAWLGLRVSSQHKSERVIFCFKVVSKWFRWFFKKWF